ncbi:hypothetical protein AVEN_261826-1, partial [Araneus ventricosus]
MLYDEVDTETGTLTSDFHTTLQERRLTKTKLRCTIPA